MTECPLTENELECVRLLSIGKTYEEQATVLGITEASQVLPHTGDSYAQYDNVGICESGVIGVLLGANVTARSPARWNTANKTWTGAAQSATVVTIPGAEFEVAGSSGAIGLVRYRRPVPSLSVSG